MICRRRRERIGIGLFERLIFRTQIAAAPVAPGVHGIADLLSVRCFLSQRCEKDGGASTNKSTTINGKAGRGAEAGVAFRGFREVVSVACHAESYALKTIEVDCIRHYLGGVCGRCIGGDEAARPLLEDWNIQHCEPYIS